MGDKFIEAIGDAECSCPMTNEEHRVKAHKMIAEERDVVGNGFVHPSVDDIYDDRHASVILPIASLQIMRVTLHRELTTMLDVYDEEPDSMTDGELRWMLMLLAVENGSNQAGHDVAAADIMEREFPGGLTDGG